METEAPFKEVMEEIKTAGGDAFKRCFQCGLCDAVCPWNRVRPFSMRKIVREAMFGLTEIESEDIWRCTTCGSCPSHCPRGVDQIEVGVALRRVAAEYQIFPESVSAVRGAGASLTADDVTELGKKVLKIERDFNERAGFTAKDDRLPDYFKNETLAPHDVTFQVTDEELDQVYNF